MAAVGAAAPALVVVHTAFVQGDIHISGVYKLIYKKFIIQGSVSIYIHMYIQVI